MSVQDKIKSVLQIINMIQSRTSRDLVLARIRNVFNVTAITAGLDELLLKDFCRFDDAGDGAFMAFDAQTRALVISTDLGEDKRYVNELPASFTLIKEDDGKIIKVIPTDGASKPAKEEADKTPKYPKHDTGDGYKTIGDTLQEWADLALNGSFARNTPTSSLMTHHTSNPFHHRTMSIIKSDHAVGHPTDSTTEVKSHNDLELILDCLRIIRETVHTGSILTLDVIKVRHVFEFTDVSSVIPFVIKLRVAFASPRQAAIQIKDGIITLYTPDDEAGIAFETGLTLGVMLVKDDNCGDFRLASNLATLAKTNDVDVKEAYPESSTEYNLGDSGDIPDSFEPAMHDKSVNPTERVRTRITRALTAIACFYCTGRNNISVGIASSGGCSAITNTALALLNATTEANLTSIIDRVIVDSDVALVVNSYRVSPVDSGRGGHFIKWDPSACEFYYDVVV